MWQFGWMISLIPDGALLWAVNAALISGAVLTLSGFFIKFIPMVNLYRFPIQLLGVILLCLGLYFKGGYATEIMWRERVAELERKVRDAEERGNEVNTVIQTKIVKKIEQIHTNGENIITYVDREIVKYDDSCKIPAEAVKALNAAAQNQPVKETKAGNNLILKLAMMLQ